MKFGLKDETLKQIQNTLAEFPEIKKVILYGSRAKGTFKASSDIDITLIGADIQLKTLNALSNKLDDLLLPYTFDISIHHQIKNKDLLDHIARVGLELFSTE